MPEASPAVRRPTKQRQCSPRDLERRYCRSLIGKWTPRGNWLTATTYAVNDLVTESNNLYICIIAHTSGVFATDLAAGKWQLVDGGNARLADNQTFTGANTFTGAVDMTGGTPTVPTAAVGDSDTSAASTAFVQAATGKVYVQTFTANGTYTPHAGMVNCIIECWGAGGGGGGVAVPGTANCIDTGGGGGAGSYARKLATAAAVGVSKAVTIGAAGTTGAAGNNAGGAGGDTSVGSLCIGKGGSGGGGHSGTANTVATAGAGGVAGTGDVTATGQSGGAGYCSTASVPVSYGGSSSVGGGGAAVGGVIVATAGNVGTGRGSGGSDGWSFNGTSTAAGGAGTAGYVVITEFCNQ